MILHFIKTRPCDHDGIVSTKTNSYKERKEHTKRKEYESRYCAVDSTVRERLEDSDCSRLRLQASRNG